MSLFFPALIENSYVNDLPCKYSPNPEILSYHAHPILGECHYQTSPLIAEEYLSVSNEVST